jgi:hypothetical protein
MPPTAFLSYSWDDDTHKGWARALAERLRGDGVDATLDQWAAVPGDQLPAFMERAITKNEFVLIACTPRYKERSDHRRGGVGYEGDIITAELLQSGNQRKFIPILRRGSWEEAAPAWLAGKYYIDLRDGERYDAQYQDLLSTIVGTRPVAPPLGPLASTATRSRAPVQPHPASSDEPVRIIGVIADDVGEPRNDGTQGSALYTIPFRLSKPVSHAWARLFEQLWNRPPRFTTMHRPGIAHARGNRIVLNGTTIEEVQRYHRETLILCVAETNRLIAEHEATQERERDAAQQATDEHRRRIRDAADKIRFDE